MSLRLVLAASAVLAFAAPAIAQEAPAAPPAAEAPSPELMEAVARVESIGERMEGLMEDLDTRAAGVRADAALSDEEKATRIRAMIAEHQPAFDEFGAALADLIRVSAMAEGSSAEEAAAAATAVQAQMMSIIEQELITGESADDEDEAAEEAEEIADHEGH